MFRETSGFQRFKEFGFDGLLISDAHSYRWQSLHEFSEVLPDHRRFNFMTTMKINKIFISEGTN